MVFARFELLNEEVSGERVLAKNRPLELSGSSVNPRDLGCGLGGRDSLHLVQVNRSHAQVLVRKLFVDGKLREVPCTMDVV